MQFAIDDSAGSDAGGQESQQKWKRDRDALFRHSRRGCGKNQRSGDKRVESWERRKIAETWDNENEHNDQQQSIRGRHDVDDNHNDFYYDFTGD